MIQETWLLTGGAGYIGAHIADEFIRAGKSVVIYDSLYQGLEHRISYLRTKHNIDIPLIKADIRDYNEIEGVIRKYKIDGIVHTAALKAVGESMEKPDEYFEVNLTATNELIDIAKRNNVKKFIFSSTAAVYGSPDSMDPCKEDGPKAPISPYGDSKYQAEAKVTAFINTPGNHGTSLRFFNVVGTAAPELLDNSVENLVPIVLGKLNAGKAPEIFGTDYPTTDGTCVRDYVDVRDIAACTFSCCRCHPTSSTCTQHRHRAWCISARDHQACLRSNQQNRYPSHRKPTSRRRSSLPMRRHQPCKDIDGLHL
jgi:UDP-glucose 4-epimerase